MASRKATTGRSWSVTATYSADSSAKSLRRPSFRLRGLFFPILRQRGGFERTQKTGRDLGYFIDGSQKRAFVGLRGFVKTTDLPHELERSSSNLCVSYWRIEIEEGFDIPAHGESRYQILAAVFLNCALALNCSAQGGANGH